MKLLCILMTSFLFASSSFALPSVGIHAELYNEFGVFWRDQVYAHDFNPENLEPANLHLRWLDQDTGEAFGLHTPLTVEIEPTDNVDVYLVRISHDLQDDEGNSYEGQQVVKEFKYKHYKTKRARIRIYEYPLIRYQIMLKLTPKFVESFSEDEAEVAQAKQIDVESRLSVVPRY